MEKLAELLIDYKPFDELEAVFVKQLRQFLETGNNHYDRSNLIAHVVADAWIVNPSRTQVVLVEHAASKAWMSPGGHCDGSSDIWGAAVREATEEAGLENLKPLLGSSVFDVNTGHVEARRKSHGIEPPHIHFDVCFAFEAPENAPLKISEESTALKWVPVNDLPKGFWPEHYRRQAKTLAGWLK